MLILNLMTKGFQKSRSVYKDMSKMPMDFTNMTVDDMKGIRNYAGKRVIQAKELFKRQGRRGTVVGQKFESQFLMSVSHTPRAKGNFKALKYLNG